MIEPLLGQYRKNRRAPEPQTLERKRLIAREGAARKRVRYPVRTSASYKASSANQRAAHFGVSGRLTSLDILSLWERQPVCVACGSGRGLDHVVAMADGGPNLPENIQNLCRPCNVAKGAINDGKFRRRERCRHGHSIVTDGRGVRLCAICKADAQRRRRAARKAIRFVGKD